MDFETRKYPPEILKDKFNEPEKVIHSAIMRACNKDLIEYGASLRCGWITQKGLDYLANNRPII